MNFKVHLRESLLNLFSAKLRSVLAILGVLVGTAAVVALMASSRLATDHALAQFKSLGTNLLTMNIHDVRSLKKESTEQNVLSLSQIPLLVHSSDQIVSAAPYIELYDGIVLYGKTQSGQIIGVTSQFKSIAKVNMRQGRFISPFDTNEFYCVIGSSIAEVFKRHHVNPIGQQIKLGRELFTVVGVMAPWKPNLFLFVNLNRAVVIPFQTMYLLRPRVNIHNVVFRLVKDPNISEVQEKLSTKMTQLLPKMKLQFRNPEQIIHLVGKERKTFDSLLIAIGSIALIVGGIGVMNIMLVSVVERRREIGVRLAVGAQRWNILVMFLMESVMLTVFGGLIGILFGLVVTYVLSYLAGWGFYFYLMPPILGFLVSVLVGILSGFYPAWRASKLDPIACLTL